MHEHDAVRLRHMIDAAREAMPLAHAREQIWKSADCRDRWPLDRTG
ncbi:MAG: hypothetical protein OXF62_09035 [Caldilineaceae bacterium]|nr:hypothetical protein [Caldilineaceae bacterium]MCY4090951.1 hypothetical protein [Caldilineaceae bacterium]MCY4117384.1 hypothetical protein [Caldilineaceae bacterium]MDE0071038.1 hypothetical protein [Caldilineaceae bacterium]MDE0179815.1 hypothetical protein [Caldilineaceae bacterium]